MADDGFHEIQLGKKQLVFAFMAAAVALVVTFLIGVWVGRDVRRPDSELVAEAPAGDITPDAPQPPTQVPPQDLDYNARLQMGAANTTSKPQEAVKPVDPPTPAAETGPPETAPKPAAATDTKKTTPDAKTTSEGKPATAAAAPSAKGVMLQVGAFGSTKPADTLMNRLKKKGYDAFVFTAPSGPSRYKVRVGPFADRPAADAASARLKAEERLTPLVVR